MFAKGKPIPWNRAAFNWNFSQGINEQGSPRPTPTGTPYTWADVYFIVEALGEPYNPLLWSPEKKRKFVKLLCKVKGIEYVEGKEVEKTQIFITDIALVAREVAGIEIQIEI